MLGKGAPSLAPLKTPNSKAALRVSRSAHTSPAEAPVHLADRTPVARSTPSSPAGSPAGSPSTVRARLGAARSTAAGFALTPSPSASDRRLLTQEELDELGPEDSVSGTRYKSYVCQSR